MIDKGKVILDSIWVKWRRMRYLKVLLLGISATLVIGTLLPIILPDFELFALVLLLLAFLAGSYFYQKKNEKSQRKFMLAYLNANYADLEYSIELLEENEADLSELKRYQSQKLADVLVEKQYEIKVEERWLVPLLLLLFSLGFCFLFPRADWSFLPMASTLGIQDEATIQLNESQKNKGKIKPVKLLGQSHKISPPAYTQIPMAIQKTPDIKSVQGSRIDWSWTFNGKMEEGFFLLNDGEKRPLTVEGKHLVLNGFLLEENGFYSLSYKGIGGEIQHTDYHRLSVIPDEAPQIKIVGLQEYNSFPYDSSTTVSLEARISDDFGLGQTRLITTVSKGAGEAVQFANDTTSLAETVLSSKQKTAFRVINLHQLGLGPGDELYFHLEVADNKHPYPNITRTHKYIAVFEDTTKIELDVSGSLAVSLLPVYFRSQRQIIIDTEKLIEERANLDQQIFQNRSENIGADQKLLRLRYGKFLGEESVTEIGPGESTAHHNHDDHDHEKQAPKDDHEGHNHDDHDDHDHDHEGHNHDDHDDHDHDHEGHNHDDHEGHDHENHPHDEPAHEDHDEENHAQVHGNNTHENHGHEGHDHGEIEPTDEGNPNGNLLEAYMHMHDNLEEATYFDGATMAKLRAALSFMWDAELHLRLHRPEQAIPYERKALKLIKEIQQASRVYVERAGFEPPEIKVAEKRLKGELDKIIGAETELTIAEKQDFPQLQQAIPLLEKLQGERSPLAAKEKQLLQAAGNELARLAILQPGQYLKPLGQIRDVLEGKLPPDERTAYLAAIQAAFMTALPDDKEAQRVPRPNNRLSRIYLDKIGGL